MKPQSRMAVAVKLHVRQADLGGPQELKFSPLSVEEKLQ